MSIVLGCSYAKVVATLANRTFTYSLPLTNREGRQIETYEPVGNPRVGIGDDPENYLLTRVNRVKGYWIYWDLSYDSFINGEDVINMYAIMERHRQGYTLTLYPREDQDWRYFTVIPDNQALQLGITAGGYTGFNTNWNFRFVTKNLEQDLKLQVAEEAPTIAYLITNYASV